MEGVRTNPLQSTITRGTKKRGKRRLPSVVDAAHARRLASRFASMLLPLFLYALHAPSFSQSHFRSKGSITPPPSVVAISSKATCVCMFEKRRSPQGDHYDLCWCQCSCCFLPILIPVFYLHVFRRAQLQHRNGCGIYRTLSLHHLERGWCCGCCSGSKIFLPFFTFPSSTSSGPSPPLVLLLVLILVLALAGLFPANCCLLALAGAEVPCRFEGRELFHLRISIFRGTSRR